MPFLPCGVAIVVGDGPTAPKRMNGLGTIRSKIGECSASASASPRSVTDTVPARRRPDLERFSAPTRPPRSRSGRRTRGDEGTRPPASAPPDRPDLGSALMRRLHSSSAVPYPVPPGLPTWYGETPGSVQPARQRRPWANRHETAPGPTRGLGRPAHTGTPREDRLALMDLRHHCSPFGPIGTTAPLYRAVARQGNSDTAWDFGGRRCGPARLGHEDDA